MKITRNNYETYFIDYHDGVLTAEQVAELFLFLESNYDLKNEFETFATFQLETTDESYEFSDALKRGEINEQNLSYYLIGALEGDLSAEDKELLNDYVQHHPNVNAELKLFEATVLDKNNRVEFPDKKSLKQPVPFYFNVNRSMNMAIAAMLLLSIIAGGYFVYTKISVKNEIKIAELPETFPTPAPNRNENVETPAPNHQSEKVSFPVKEEMEYINNNTDEVNTNTPKKVQPVNNSIPEINPEPKLKIPVQIMNSIQNETVPVAELKNEAAPKLTTVKTENNFASNVPAPSPNTFATDEYISVWEALRQGATNNIRKITESESGDQLASNNDTRNTDIKILEVIGKGIEKVSNDKVQVDARYNDQGKLSAFQFVAGKFKIERTNHE